MVHNQHGQLLPLLLSLPSSGLGAVSHLWWDFAPFSFLGDHLSQVSQAGEMAQAIISLPYKHGDPVQAPEPTFLKKAMHGGAYNPSREPGEAESGLSAK